jgi:hypothetical protein
MGLAGAAAATAAAANLLYIVVDDLRTELGGVYGVEGMVTPGIDRLMGEGTTFSRAYTQVTVCSPSRTSFLTGMRPRNTRTWTIGPYFRDQAHNASSIVTVSQALKTAGWNVTGAGKVWHPGSSSGGALTPSVGGDDMPMSCVVRGRERVRLLLGVRQLEQCQRPEPRFRPVARRGRVRPERRVRRVPHLAGRLGRELLPHVGLPRLPGRLLPRRPRRRPRDRGALLEGGQPVVRPVGPLSGLQAPPPLLLRPQLELQPLRECDDAHRPEPLPQRGDARAGLLPERGD